MQDAAEARGHQLPTVGDGAMGIALERNAQRAPTHDDPRACSRGGGKTGAVALQARRMRWRTCRRRSRADAYLTHPVFNAHHSETEMMRYIRSLERKDIGLDTR